MYQGIWCGMILGGTFTQTVTLAIITMKFNWDKEVEFYIDDWCCTGSTWIHMIFYSQVLKKFICRLKRLGIAWTNGQNPGQRDDCSPNGCARCYVNYQIQIVILIIEEKLNDYGVFFYTAARCWMGNCSSTMLLASFFHPILYIYI